MGIQKSQMLWRIQNEAARRGERFTPEAKEETLNAEGIVELD
jgi:hypothetical protein